MFPFSQSITPAAKNHVQAQVSYFNDLSRSIFQMAQQFTEINLQLAQTWLQDFASTSQAVLTAGKPTEVFAVTAARAQPVADRFRSYQQQLAKVAADGQTALIRVAGEHADETARAAREFTDEVTRVTSEETERTLRQQHDTMRQFANPLDSMVDSATRQARAAMGNGHDFMDQASQATQAAARSAMGQRTEGQPS
jgi:phasin family protein